MNKPKALSPGDKVAIVSLSSGMLGEDFSKHELDLGIKRLDEFGLEPVFMKNALKGIEFLKNHPEARAQDLKEAFMDDSIKGIICAIGGNDTYRLLPYLLEDEEFIKKVRKTPKLFTGYSDTTINHLMFYKLGMTSFYGPNFICDLAELGEEMLPYTKASFQGYFKEHEPKTITSSDVWYDERIDFSSNAVGMERNSHIEIKGYEILQGCGKFKGRLLGGCLESFYDMLSSTRYDDEGTICEKYSIFPSKDEWKDKILFIETSEEKPIPELLELELLALKEKGLFDVISGILVGKPQDEQYYEEYKEVYCKVIKNTSLPILYNINFGHSHPKCIIPYGIEAGVNMEEKTIAFKESLFD
ncbi:LD-carboxypeptidase [Clostridium botulinum]|nr:LD-carboxypeptidase [Clostridium botulinum]NFR15816.1 LD-carboxypeptidase [Clostridium botulinum]NFR44715.1 LD-carboxypeptidase [Clostridium botulinum]NFS51571.1 LD-carboxypeptidase [Clostridium botulinum]